jgi:hypothetical protein
MDTHKWLEENDTVTDEGTQHLGFSSGYIRMNYWGGTTANGSHIIKTEPIDLSPPVDTAVSPSHYDKGGKQVWDAMKDLSSEEEYRGYLTLNVVKYITRHRKKNGRQDLLKARAYLDKLIETDYPEPKEENK